MCKPRPAAKATEGHGERGFNNPNVKPDETFTELADHVRSMPEILRANLYNTDGQIVWSRTLRMSHSVESSNETSGRPGGCIHPS